MIATPCLYDLHTLHAHSNWKDERNEEEENRDTK